MIKTVLKAPKKLCIYDSRTSADVYSLLYRINEEANSNKSQITLDLREVEQITAAASVLLFATINTCQLMQGDSNQVRCIFPTEKKNPNGYRYIVRTGLARALMSGNFDKLEELVKAGAYFQSSTNPSLHLIETVNFITKNANLNEEQFIMLTSGIGEAMLNVFHHAYKNPKTVKDTHQSKALLVEVMGERWWQCAWYDEEKRTWVFIICDLGIGIPQSYGHNIISPLYTTTIKELMLGAFTLGKSRFIGKGRGNGSEDIKSVIGINKINSETLLVYSGGIKYTYLSGEQEPEVEDLKRFFMGTLIEWQVQLEEQQ